MRNPTYILPLGTLTGADAYSAGAKAATLGDLARAGFPVPDGFVLATGAYARFLTANALHRDSSAETVAAAPLPRDVADAVLTAAERFKAAPLAVRSSAVAEDLPGASFAGQYETVLDVRDPGALLEAVRHCWSLRLLGTRGRLSCPQPGWRRVWPGAARPAPRAGGGGGRGLHSRPRHGGRVRDGH